MLSPKQISTFHTSLREWYDANGRKDLPWRVSDDPYHIYLSEVMLQQTQVKTVLERFYVPFLNAFPSLATLANASEESVLKAWEGLGYYSRARNLHKAAKLATPSLPYTIEELLSLPGIGKNTAHAIATFAYHQSVPVMEANVKRVLCRIFALERPTDQQLWDYAYSLVDSADPFTYNQAMMDIGATICTPKNPNCATCPAAKACAGKKMAEAYPQRKEKKAIPIRRPNIIVIQDINGALYMTPRETRFLGGMYQFIELGAEQDTLEFMGDSIALASLTKLGNITHTYSHFKLEADVYHYALNVAGNGAEWLNQKTITTLPLSGADKKVLGLLK